MLTLRSRMKRNGFSIMDVDELYFINGGCGPTGGNGGCPSGIPSSQSTSGGNSEPQSEKKENPFDSLGVNTEQKKWGLSFEFKDGKQYVGIEYRF